ncbi:hypothetical protein CHARACLAT_000085 [Characodon lateralis]|uniref:Uncharacterized protein n=1 Tax=Characodon lateralis TaxID=208331 RepID=A0ABU7F1I3_9TELE|nr:hypothetical protein [Characodon lateralis]
MESKSAKKRLGSEKTPFTVSMYRHTFFFHSSNYPIFSSCQVSTCSYTLPRTYSVLILILPLFRTPLFSHLPSPLFLVTTSLARSLIRTGQTMVALLNIFENLETTAYIQYCGPSHLRHSWAKG